MATKVTVRGDREIIANIRRTRAALGGRMLDGILSSSLAPMRDETEQNARKHRQPRQPRGGHLDEGIVIAKRNSRGALYREYWISFTRRARKLAHLVEYGTAPHFQPNRGIMHPGARAFPFFRPAFESTKKEVVDDVGLKTWAVIRASVLGARRK